MRRKDRNWLIAVVVIVILAAILILVFWRNSSRKDMNDHKTENPAVSSSEPAEKTDGNLQSYMDEQDTIMAKMMVGMNSVAETGNASVHFLKGMIPHHEAAIEMAKSYLNHNGKEEELERIAEDIITAQTKEIDEMETMITRIEGSGLKDADKEAAYISEYDKMMKEHEHGGHTDHENAIPANVDQAFAEGMIMHHQMAIDMSKAVLNYTDEDDVKSLAQSIIETQEREIEEMQNIINNSESAS